MTPAISNANASASNQSFQNFVEAVNQVQCAGPLHHVSDMTQSRVRGMATGPSCIGRRPEVCRRRAEPDGAGTKRRPPSAPTMRFTRNTRTCRCVRGACFTTWCICRSCASSRSARTSCRRWPACRSSRRAPGRATQSIGRRRARWPARKPPWRRDEGALTMARYRWPAFRQAANAAIARE